MLEKSSITQKDPLITDSYPPKITTVARLFVFSSNYIALWNAIESSNVFTHTENTAGGLNFTAVHFSIIVDVKRLNISIHIRCAWRNALVDNIWTFTHLRIVTDSNQLWKMDFNYGYVSGQNFHDKQDRSYNNTDL